MSDRHRLIKLFLYSLYISAFTFGGGFVIVSIMKKKYVDELCWLDEKEMLDITAISQSAPGPIAVNAAILVGKKIGGVMGIFAAVLGTIIPPMVILSIVSVFYDIFASNMYVALLLKGMQAGVFAVILDVVLGLGQNVFKQKSLFKIILMFAAFIANVIFKINVIYIIVAAILIGVASVIIEGRRHA